MARFVSEHQADMDWSIGADLIYDYFEPLFKKEIYADTRSKIGGLLAKPAFKRVKKTMDYTEVGGAPLLGVQGVVVKAHGSSNAHAIACAIRQAALTKRKGLVEYIEKKIAKQLQES